MIAVPSRLILVADNRRTVPTRPIQPHIRLALSTPTRLIQHLKRRLVSVQDRKPEKPFPHPVIDRRKHLPALYDPVGKNLPRKIQPNSLEALLDPIQRHRLHELLAHHPSNRRRRRQALRNQRTWPGSRHYRSGDLVPVAVPAAVDIPHVPDHFHLIHALRIDGAQHVATCSAFETTSTTRKTSASSFGSKPDRTSIAAEPTRTLNCDPTEHTTPEPSDHSPDSQPPEPATTSVSSRSSYYASISLLLQAV
jgi:hypothetical protein